MTIVPPGTFSSLGGRAWVIKDFFNAIEEEPEANTRLDESPSPSP
jgi:hypothetical protein